MEQRVGVRGASAKPCSGKWLAPSEWPGTGAPQPWSVENAVKEWGFERAVYALVSNSRVRGKQAGALKDQVPRHESVLAQIGHELQTGPRTVRFAYRDIRAANDEAIDLAIQEFARPGPLS